MWEKVPVCLPRVGNGTGTWEALWLTGRVGSTRFLGGTGSCNGSGTGRETIRKHTVVGKTVGDMLGNIIRKLVGNVAGYQRETQSGMVGNTIGNAGPGQRLKRRGK